MPQVERRPIIACTLSSVKSPGRAPDGFALLRVLVGGAYRGVGIADCVCSGEEARRD